MGEIRVGIIDDHAIVRQGLRAMIDREPDLRVVGEAASAATATAMLDRARGEFGGDLVGEFVANAVRKPRLHMPVVNAEMRCFDYAHTARMAAVGDLGTCPIG
jgi:hypothetical protein